MKPNSLAAAIIAGSMFGTGGILNSYKTSRKCLLKDCQVFTRHNGGYCCAYHCKLDRERRKVRSQWPR